MELTYENIVKFFDSYFEAFNKNKTKREALRKVAQEDTVKLIDPTSLPEEKYSLFSNSPFCGDVSRDFSPFFLLQNRKKYFT